MRPASASTGYTPATIPTPASTASGICWTASTQLTNPALGNQSGSAGPINVSPATCSASEPDRRQHLRQQRDRGVQLRARFPADSSSRPTGPSTWPTPDGDAFFVEIPAVPCPHDACGITIPAVDITDVTCADIGTPIVVTVFASDASGNLASCTSIVTVVDESGPTLGCPGDMTVDPGPTTCSTNCPTTGARDRRPLPTTVPIR